MPLAAILSIFERATPSLTTLWYDEPGAAIQITTLQISHSPISSASDLAASYVAPLPAHNHRSSTHHSMQHLTSPAHHSTLTDPLDVRSRNIVHTSI